MASIRERLVNMFSKVVAGTVTREEGGMLINSLVRDDPVTTPKDLAYLLQNPPMRVFPKTILHIIILARNKALFRIFADSLDHKDEEVAIMAAREMGRQRTEEAKSVLTEHLKSELYHSRKASAEALACFGNEGMEILKSHILTQREPFYRMTSACGLVSAGRRGVEALVEMIKTGNADILSTTAEVFATCRGDLRDEDVPVIVDALMRAGDREDVPAITGLLKIIAFYRERARRFEGYVEAFSDYPSDTVRSLARSALRELRG